MGEERRRSPPFESSDERDMATNALNEAVGGHGGGAPPLPPIRK